jgi:hypothetical protein
MVAGLRSIAKVLESPPAPTVRAPVPDPTDEREQATELSQTGLRRRRESFVSSHREAKATASVLDSTQNHRDGAGGSVYVPKHFVKNVLALDKACGKGGATATMGEWGGVAQRHA